MELIDDSGFADARVSRDEVLTPAHRRRRRRSNEASKVLTSRSLPYSFSGTRSRSEKSPCTQ